MTGLGFRGMGIKVSGINTSLTLLHGRMRHFKAPCQAPKDPPFPEIGSTCLLKGSLTDAKPSEEGLLQGRSTHQSSCCIWGISFLSSLQLRSLSLLRKWLMVVCF
jgi:hypothetical protein